MCTMHGMDIDLNLLRQVAAKHGVDSRTVEREIREPGSVRGLAGERARRAVREARGHRDSNSRPPPQAA
jgi:carbamoylphosphate synthase small subunit